MLACRNPGAIEPKSLAPYQALCIGNARERTLIA